VANPNRMRALVFLVASPTCVAGIAAAPRLLTARNFRAMPKGLLEPLQVRTLVGASARLDSPAFRALRDARRP
jgi:hypothetical protein